MSDFVAPNTDRVQGRQIENPLISKNHKRKRGSDSSSDCTLTIEVIIPGLSEPPVRTLRATIPENESHIFR